LRLSFPISVDPFALCLRQSEVPRNKVQLLPALRSDKVATATMSDSTATPPDFSILPEPDPGVFTAPLRRPAHVGPDWLEPKQRDYSAGENAIWDDLYARQMQVLPGRAASAFMAGLDRLDLGRGGVPELARLSRELDGLTGWSVIPVPMLIPDHVFFWHLANRRFPAGNFIRTREHFDYIEQPDVFHDIFGHAPLLADPTYAAYMQEYGRAGWKAMRHNRLKALGALYWYTVEFGLILEDGNPRAYGAGILSGPSEAVFAIEGRSPNRIMLNVDRAMRTDYVIDDLQPTYFVIESFADLYHQTVERDFDRLYRALPPGFTYANTAVIDIDDVLQRGTQEYLLRGGRGSCAEPV
jgi:phenylalanine-4-hydroxylase